MARKKREEEVAEDQNPYSPRRNSLCRGHATAEADVLNAWNSGRFHHAILMTGPSGIGKATFAYRVARFVLSGTRPGGDGGLAVNPESGVFRRVASGGHSDLRVLDRGDKTQIPIDSVRDVLGFARRTPAESDWRVVIVDKADHLNRNSANALLKVLEEPPPRCLFLLVADAPGRLLPTIRSRCRLLPLFPLATGEVSDLLRHYRPETSSEEAETLAKLADGSIGRALSYHDAGGLDLYARLIGVIGEPKSDNVGPIFTLADRVAEKGAEASFEALRALLDWWLKRWICSKARGEDPVPTIAGEENAFAALRRMGGLETWMSLWENLTAQMAGVDPPQNLDKRQVVVGAFLSLRAMQS